MVDAPGRITLWGIEVFVATAEEGALQLAAARLGASVSGVSQQLSTLEAALGVTLLDRRHRPVRLTPGGEVFITSARRILAEADRARAGLALADLSQLSRFRLGMIDDFEAEVTPCLLQEIAADFTQSRFLLETGPSHRLLAELEAWELDLVVVSEPAELPDTIGRWPVLSEGFVIAAPKGRLTPAALAEQITTLPLIQISERLQMGRMIRAHLGQEGIDVPYRFEIDSYHAVLALVAAGAGWTMLTPLALARTARVAAELDIFALPCRPLRRRISVLSRPGQLGELPARIADRLKALVQERICAKLVAARPMLADFLVIE